MAKVLISRVAGSEGRCVPTWLCGNRILYAIDGGPTGFFRKVERGRLGFLRKVGPELHGIVRRGYVYSTEGIS